MNLKVSRKKIHLRLKVLVVYVFSSSLFRSPPCSIPFWFCSDENAVSSIRQENSSEIVSITANKYSRGRCRQVDRMVREVSFQRHTTALSVHSTKNHSSQEQRVKHSLPFSFRVWVLHTSSSEKKQNVPSFPSEDGPKQSLHPFALSKHSVWK